MAKQTIKVPDIGGAKDVEIIEIYVDIGDSVEKEQAIVALESEKASMDIPSPVSGKVTAIKIALGDLVSESDALIELEIADIDSESESKSTDTATEPDAKSNKPETPNKETENKKPEKTENSEVPEENKSESTEKAKAAKKAAHGESKKIVNLPDIGGAKDVEIIEIYVDVGDSVEKEQAIVALESEKASMDIPSPVSGKVTGLRVKVGDLVSEGAPLIEVEIAETNTESTAAATESAEEPDKSDSPQQVKKAETSETETTKKAVFGENSSDDVYAGPSVRKFAREISVDLSKVTGTGLRSRITKSNVKDYVKSIMTGRAVVAGSNTGVPPIPAVDFSAFGEVDMQKMSKIKKLTAANMTRNWLNIPHVTQFDDADITHLEAFRKDLKAEAEEKGTKLTLMPFLLKACAGALRNEPSFNASINTDGTQLVYKKYVHIGVAVDTPVGLMVPVLRDVDKKGLWQLAAEFAEITQKARDGKLVAGDMQGGCFTISSLGAIGGNGFTPIVNAPEVAILGVSKASVKPVWNGNEFVPRQMLPLSLSYDHRAVNGADAGRFFTCLIAMIADVRRLLL